MLAGTKQKNRAEDEKRTTVGPKKEISYLASAPETRTRRFPRRRNGNNNEWANVNLNGPFPWDVCPSIQPVCL